MEPVGANDAAESGVVDCCSDGGNLLFTCTEEHGALENSRLVVVRRNLEKDQHVRQVFQQELSQVKDLLVSTSKETTYAIQGACGALSSLDKPRAESVIAHDASIDDLTTDLDELSIAILARQQPVARDLRVVVSALRMSANLERMGDLAKHIAQVVTYLDGPLAAGTAIPDIFAQMAEHVIDQSEQVTRLLETEDVEIAHRISEDDDLIDDLHAKVFDITLAGGWTLDATQTVNVTLTNRYFERFADHAVRVAEKMVYLSTGDWS